MKKFLLNLQFIFKPWYWVMNEPYSEQMDCIMNCLLDEHDFTKITQHTAYLGEYEIWIENRPYSSMVVRSHSSSCRASRLTIKRAIDKLGDRIINEETIKVGELREIQIKVCKH